MISHKPAMDIYNQSAHLTLLYTDVIARLQPYQIKFYRDTLEALNDTQPDNSQDKEFAGWTFISQLIAAIGWRSTQVLLQIHAPTLLEVYLRNADLYDKDTDLLPFHPNDSSVQMFGVNSKR